MRFGACETRCALDDRFDVILLEFAVTGKAIELGEQLALRQRDDASELAEAPVLDRDPSR